MARGQSLRSTIAIVAIVAPEAQFQKLSRNWTFAKILLSDTKMKQVLLGFLFEHIKSIAKSLKNTEN